MAILSRSGDKSIALLPFHTFVNGEPFPNTVSAHFVYTYIYYSIVHCCDVMLTLNSVLSAVIAACDCCALHGRRLTLIREYMNLVVTLHTNFCLHVRSSSQNLALATSPCTQKKNNNETDNRILSTQI